jgi:hypothetical protein
VRNQAWPGAPRDSGWSRLTIGQKASVIGAGLLIALLAALTLIGASGHFPGRSAGSRPSPAPATSTQSTGLMQNGQAALR